MHLSGFKTFNDIITFKPVCLLDLVSREPDLGLVIILTPPIRATFLTRRCKEPLIFARHVTNTEIDSRTIISKTFNSITFQRYSILVVLHSSIRLAVLLKSTMLRRLVLVTAAGAAAATAITGLATLTSGLMRVDLAVGKLASSDTTVGLAILAEAVVL